MIPDWGVPLEVITVLVQRVQSFRVAVVAVLLTAASGTALGAQVAELHIAPTLVELQSGETRTVVVTGYDAAGNTIPGVPFTFSGGVGVVNLRPDPDTPSFLLIEGVTEGEAAVTVTSGSVSSTLRVVVQGGGGPVGSGPAAVLTIEPQTIFLLPIEEQQLQAVFLRADGELASRVPVTWQSLYEPVATVTPQGKVIGISPGNGAILVEASNGLSARAAVQVGHAQLGFGRSRLSMQPLAADTIEVVVPSQGNRRIANRQLRFGSTNPAVAAVTPLGVVNSIQMGDAEIIVRGFGQEVRLPVTVHPAVRWMTAAPRDRNVTVPVGGSRPLTVTFEADDRSPVPEARAGWSSTDPTVAAYDDATGRVRGVSVGSTLVKATGPGPGLEYEWTVNVVAGEVSLDRTRIGLAPGQVQIVSASFVDDNGTNLGPVADLDWQSSDVSVATVEPDGAITGVGFGRTTVTAITSWGDRQTVDVFVQGRVLISNDRNGSADVYSFDPSAPERQNRITDLPGTELGAVYAPDHTRIVFVSHQGTNAELVMINADGTDPMLLTNTLYDEGSPSFSPDGSHIVYTVSTIESQRLVSNIWIMNADGSDARPLTTGSFVRDEPVVSPDGTMIAYRSSEIGGRNVFLMNVDGTGVRPLTSDEQSAVSPRWFPDGRLAYVSMRQTGRRSSARTVTLVDVGTGAAQALTPDSVSVQEFAVLDNGDLVMMVESWHRDLIERRLFLYTLSGAAAGTLTEVPRQTETEQYLTPRTN